MRKNKIRYAFARCMTRCFQPMAVKNSNIDKRAHIGTGSQIVNSTIGKYSYIGPRSVILHSSIGSFCSIADGVHIGGASHPTDWVSTSPVFTRGRNILKKNFSTLEYDPFSLTKIGNDVWIGTNSLIKSGCIIEDGAVIGMGSVLTKNVGKYEIWAGNPAKLIKKRFSDTVVDELADIRWWDFEDDRLEAIGGEFKYPEQFIQNRRRNT